MKKYRRLLVWPAMGWLLDGLFTAPRSWMNCLLLIDICLRAGLIFDLTLWKLPRLYHARCTVWIVSIVWYICMKSLPNWIGNSVHARREDGQGSFKDFVSAVPWFLLVVGDCGSLRKPRTLCFAKSLWSLDISPGIWRRVSHTKS